MHRFRNIIFVEIVLIMEINTENYFTGESRITAILCYITIFGWLFALIYHSFEKTRLGAFHLRQSLGLYLAAIIYIVASVGLAFVPFIGWLIGLAISLSLLAGWLLGLISAAGGEAKPLPFAGKYFQNIFRNLFN